MTLTDLLPPYFFTNNKEVTLIHGSVFISIMGGVGQLEDSIISNTEFAPQPGTCRILVS